MSDDSLLPFSLPSVQRKKVPAALDGGRISSNGGVMLLALAERRIGVADQLTAEIIDRRDPTRIVHALSDILRARILAIACGYEDADDLDHSLGDPALKLAGGHLPENTNEPVTRLVVDVAAAGLLAGSLPIASGANAKTLREQWLGSSSCQSARVPLYFASVRVNHGLQ